MTTALPINRLVNVSVNLAPGAAQIQNISTLLILGSSNIIDATERYRVYNSIDAVAGDFGTSAPEYLAAVLWFEQTPQPVTLLIGRWVQTAIAGSLKAATLPTASQLPAFWTGVSAPGFLARIDGIPVAITPATLAGITNMNGIASIFQSALGGSTCVWNSVYSRFEFTSSTTGAASLFNFIAPSAAVGRALFSVNPANTDTLTLNGTTVTFVSGAPAGNQVQIGATLAATLTALTAFLSASLDTQLVKFTYTLNPAQTAVYFVAATAGVSGNALTLAKSSAAITLSGANLTGATAQDVSSMIAGTSISSGAYVAVGAAAETAVDCVTTFDSNYGQTWYAVTALGVTDNDHLAIAPYIEASGNKHLYGVSTMEAGVLVSSSTTDIAYQTKQLAYKRTVVQYSSSNAYAVCSLLGRILTVDYTGNNTVITLMYKQEPGIVPETVNSSQITNLEAKNCNIFVQYNNNTAIIEKGTVASGEFLDVITGTDWLALTIQNEVYNLLYQSPTKIPQTDSGHALIATQMSKVLSQSVANGLVAPGVWDSAGFGTLKQGDFLPTGYYVYAAPVSTQGTANRSARKSMPFQIAVKLAGAIHTVSITINVNR